MVNQLIALEDVAIVYRADRGLEPMEVMQTIPQDKLNRIPSSEGMEFRQFMDVCSALFDIKERGDE